MHSTTCSCQERGLNASGSIALTSAPCAEPFVPLAFATSVSCSAGDSCARLVLHGVQLDGLVDCADLLDAFTTVAVWSHDHQGVGGVLLAQGVGSVRSLENGSIVCGFQCKATENDQYSALEDEQLCESKLPRGTWRCEKGVKAEREFNQSVAARAACLREGDPLCL